MPASSADEAVRARRLRAALLLVLAAGVAFEFGVARRPAFGERLRAGPLVQLEAAVIEPCADPAVVILGNSRTLYGVDEREVAELLGEPPERVMKLALFAGSLADSEELWRRHRERLARARLVVLAVDDYDLTRAPLPSERDLQRDHSAPIVEWDVRGWPLLALTRAVRTTETVRPALYELRREAIAKLRGRPAAPPGAIPAKGLFGERDPSVEARWREGKWAVPSSLDRAGVGVNLPSALRWSPRVVYERWYLGRLPSEAGLARTKALAEDIAAAGPRVVIARWPVADDAWRYCQERYGGFATRYLEAKADLEAWASARPGLAVDLATDGASLGWDASCFYDYGHPSPAGRARVDASIAKWAREATP